MKTLVLLVLVLSACGSAVLLEPIQGTTAELFDCRAACRTLKPQLLRAFGYADAEVDCEAFPRAAPACAACQDALRTRFGVELTACP